MGVDRLDAATPTARVRSSARTGPSAAPPATPPPYGTPSPPPPPYGAPAVHTRPYGVPPAAPAPAGTVRAGPPPRRRDGRRPREGLPMSRIRRRSPTTSPDRSRLRPAPSSRRHSRSEGPEADGKRFQLFDSGAAGGSADPVSAALPASGRILPPRWPACCTRSAAGSTTSSASRSPGCGATRWAPSTAHSAVGPGWSSARSRSASVASPEPSCSGGGAPPLRSGKWESAPQRCRAAPGTRAGSRGRRGARRPRPCISPALRGGTGPPRSSWRHREPLDHDDGSAPRPAGVAHLRSARRAP